MSVSIDDLANAIAKELHDYREEVKEDLFESIDDAADSCVASLRVTSPEETGSYKNGWRKKTAHKSDKDIRIQVHNKTDWQLTHLLEDGFSHITGGRVEGTPHIGPAADNAAAFLEKDVKMKVGLR